MHFYLAWHLYDACNAQISAPALGCLRPNTYLCVVAQLHRIKEHNAPVVRSHGYAASIVAESNCTTGQTTFVHTQATPSHLQ
jgi:hypothetical protein